MTNTLHFPTDSGVARLDTFLAASLPDLSRSRWQSLIKEGHVLVNGRAVKPNHEMRAGDTITYSIPAPRPVEAIAQDIPLNVLYEDRDLIALNKPPDLVVHPAPGHEDGTLVNALLHHCKDIQGIGGELRPGIVHRLDRDTSGVLVVAKNEAALANLAAQFKSRTTRKDYLALVAGTPRPASGTIKTLIGRSSSDRKKMTTRTKSGREAVSHYETIETFRDAALLRIRIETGRIHQIRVHMAHLGHAVLGDAVYGRARGAPRQMLHARRLELTHPATGKKLIFDAPMPDDMKQLCEKLRHA